MQLDLPALAVRKPQGEAGVTLIEVLIAVFILAFGMLGIAGLQTSALTNNNMSNQYTLATAAAQDMIERMRGNRPGVQSQSYAMVAGTAPSASNVTANCATTVCTSAQQAAWDIAYWYASLTGSSTGYSNIPTINSFVKLPSAQASVTCVNPADSNPASPTVACTTTQPMLWVVKVYWDPNRSAVSTASDYYSCNPASMTALRCISVAAYP